MYSHTRFGLIKVRYKKVVIMNTLFIIYMLLHIIQGGIAFYKCTDNKYEYSHTPYGHQFIKNTTCYITQLYNNPKNGDPYNFQFNLYDVTWYKENTISIIIRDSYISNFSASPFLTSTIACYYGNIRLIIRDSHVNKINAFPSEIYRTFGMSPKCNISYESIDVNNNNITKLDSLLFNNLARLVSLNLSKNNISTLGNFTFNNLGNLTRLNLSQNNISIVQWAFGKLNKLEELDLSSNVIKVLPHAFENTTALKYLNISYNRITAIKSSMFIYLNNLQTLDISHNLLISLEMGAFSGLINLEFMNISNNQIVTDKYFMINLPKLQHLDLSFNRLHLIDVENYKFLKGINIDGNNFSCQKLVHIIYKMKQAEIKLEVGTEKQRLNVYGMHCNDTESNEDIIINMPVETNFPKNLANFFNREFKETDFYKYFSEFSIPKQNALNKDVYTEAMKSMEKSSKNLANVLNSTLIQMLFTLQTKNKNDEQQATDNNIERSKFMEMMKELQTEMKDFDKNTNKVHEISNEKYIQATSLPVRSNEQIILIVIMCMLAIMTIAVVYNVFCKSYAEKHIFNRNSDRRFCNISRSELCPMNDAL